MKKQYQKPQSAVVELQQQSHILQASQVQNTATNLGDDTFDLVGDDTYYGGDIR